MPRLYQPADSFPWTVLRTWTEGYEIARMVDSTVTCIECARDGPNGVEIAVAEVAPDLKAGGWNTGQTEDGRVIVFDVHKRRLVAVGDLSEPDLLPEWARKHCAVFAAMLDRQQ